MKQRIMLVSVFVVISLIFSSCTGDAENPVAPSAESQLTGCAVESGQSQTHLWGYYDISIDIPSQTVSAVPDRQVMFTANVVSFINTNPASLGFTINDIQNGADFIDVDIDIAITHPFPGLPVYNGYDVRGIFMGDGSGELSWNDSLIYPILGTDQFMFPDPSGANGAPDGYTRWFNPAEFSDGGMPLFQYTPGSAASPGFAGTATLNPYKYFADSLGTNENLWTWLDDHAEQYGMFASGATNDRNYYLRFPNDKGVVYGYAIIANWEGVEPENHPSNAPEAVACSIIDQSDVWFVDAVDNGGNIELDISIRDWDSTVSAGSMEDYSIYIESPVLLNPYGLTALEMTPIDGDENYSTFHVEIAADNVTGNDDSEYWIIVESANEDYKNDFDVTNLAGDDPLTAFFRYDLNISNSPSNQNPVCDLALDEENPPPIEDLLPIAVKFDATGSYDPDGDDFTFEWDFDGDGIYGEDPDDNYTGNLDNPTHIYETSYSGNVSLKLTDDMGGQSICSIAVVITGHQSKNIPLRDGVDAIDLGVDPVNGDLWIVYSDNETYKYTSGGWYEDETDMYSAGVLSYTILFLDIAAGGYCSYVRSTGINTGSPTIIAPDGSTLVGGGWGAANEMFWGDAINFGTTGPDANNLSWFMGVINDSATGNCRYMRDYEAPYTGTYKYFVSQTYPISPVTGYNRMYHEYVQGMDTGIGNSDIWFLEAPDYYCSAFRRYSISWWYGLTYNDLYFGTGAEETGDAGWTADVCDLGRTTDSRFHVLDNVSGEGVIKVFTGSSTGGESHGHYGDSTSISSTPLRLDGSDSDGRMFVLHGNATDGYFLSVFMPSEMPG